MTEFDEWWNDEMDYAASKYEVLHAHQSEIKAREQRAAKEGWNAALKKMQESLKKYISSYDCEEVDRIKQELFQSYE